MIFQTTQPRLRRLSKGQIFSNPAVDDRSEDREMCEVEASQEDGGGKKSPGRGKG